MSETTVTISHRGDIIDLVAVERCIWGREPAPALTVAERRYAARAMRDAGMGSTPICQRLRISASTLTALLRESSVPLSGGSGG